MSVEVGELRRAYGNVYCTATNIVSEKIKIVLLDGVGLARRLCTG